MGQTQECLASFKRTEKRESGSLVQYQYDPLPDQQSIRIMTLAPGRGDSPLIGTLEIVDVLAAGYYEPITYAWGALNFDREILISSVDDKSQTTIRLTRSLFEALKRLRLPKKRRRLWADQICVNQQDFPERSQQVQFMNTIFENASRVLVWLGVDDSVSARITFDFVHKLSQTFADPTLRAAFHTAHTKDLEKQSERPWKCFDDLTRLSWFTRGWVVQEIGTKAPATMFWGDEEIDWATLAQVCEDLNDYHHLRARFRLKTSDIRSFFRRFVEPDMTSHHANRVNFIYEIQRARSLRFTDERDRVFAWLGHFSAKMSGSEIAAFKAAYSEEVSLAQVYTEAATRALRGEAENTSGTGLIALAAVQHTSLSRQAVEREKMARLNLNATLPSWVPDWRINHAFLLSEPTNPHRAHGNSAPRLSFREGGLTLCIQGAEIDTIDLCSRPLSGSEFHVERLNASGRPAIQYIWQEICQKRCLSFEEKYINGQEALFACMQTLSNGCVQIASREKRSYREISRIRWLKEEALYLDKAFKEYPDLIAADVRLLAEQGKSESRVEHWSRSANAASNGRLFARTSRGYYVLGPRVMKSGDVICVLLGGKLPFCLRRCGDRYLLVGECYVHGVMDGEVMEMLKRDQLFAQDSELV
ncbi:hypothetical protein CERZMDRAFT_39207 [Cercospora zeae-maydis SCOH1-5]|uniref:Heterokaryon incompatibility domain-containing protein n=1 Tax=Cercospora zeae-maydis SCOH1-5 TaxID=717836 RepID=A0A6A6FJ79_9PEZI|nr:hypothetical protein CERZMDRAFT_39207 [Cercospora zeae-maydis SCOH1-5]